MAKMEIKIDVNFDYKITFKRKYKNCMSDWFKPIT